MKVITKGGFCATKIKPMGFQFADQDGKVSLGGSFNATGGKVAVTGDTLPSKLYVADSYLKTGCRHCGNKYAYVCPECGTVICNDGNGNNKEICPACSSILKIERARGNDLPQATLVKRAGMEIGVTSPCFDNIGNILDSLGIQYKPFTTCQFDCNLLFINCGTSDNIAATSLQNFVKDGGCIYVSDLASRFVISAFPSLFSFKGNCGDACKIYADVVDQELVSYVGNKIEIEFDLSSWSVLKSAKGDVLLKASSGSRYAGLPIMVRVPYGNGTIFYTCFHNHAQASDKEKALLQLLVLKQLGSTTRRSIEEIGAQMGVNVEQIKAKFQ